MALCPLSLAQDMVWLQEGDHHKLTLAVLTGPESERLPPPLLLFSVSTQRQVEGGRVSLS